MAALDRRFRYAVFFGLALTINAIDSALARALPNPKIAIAATADVVLIVSALYWWLLVRPGIRAQPSLIAVTLAGLLHATYFFPAASFAKFAIAGTCEVGLVWFVVRQIRRPRDLDSDPVDAIQSALGTVISMPWLARLIALEFSVFYYALFSWKSAPHVAPGTRAFTVHEKSGKADLLAMFAFASVAEIIPVHLLLRHRSHLLAWIATALSIYGAIWILGLARSIILRPLLVGPDYVELRYGLLFRLRVPANAIQELSIEERSGGQADHVIPRGADANFVIALKEHGDAQGPLGIRKRIQRIAIDADQQSEFESALRELLVP